MAKDYTLRIKQGEDYEKNFQWTLANGTTPVDMTGMTGHCQIRNGANNPGIIKTATVTITDAANGKFKVTMSATDTAAIPTTGKTYNAYEKYVYDVEFVDTSNAVYRVLNGYAEISPEVTR